MTDNNTSDLHAGLVALQEQLEKLDSASQQIEHVKTISKSVIDAIADLQGKYDVHLDALTSENKTVLQGHDKLFQAQLTSHKEANSELVQYTEKAIEEIKLTLNDNVEKNQEIHKKNSEEITTHLTLYCDFVSKVETLTKTIEIVNFPNRLDKLDNTVSAINLGVQNLQSVVSTSEKKILEKLKENYEGLKAEFEVSKSQLKLTKSIILIFGIISILLMLTLIVKAFV